MKFVQIIDFETERMEEMRKLIEQAAQRNAGGTGGPTHRLVLKDRKTPNRYLALIEFESYDDAMRNSNDPETTRMAEQLAALCTRPPSFTDCDVREMTELK